MNNITGDAQARAAGYHDYADYQNRMAQGNPIISGASSNPIYAGAIAQEQKYIQSLMDQAGNQKDLAVKMLDAQHQLALGNNDTQTAKFLESVANTMEQQMGRIPYDYERYTTRENQQYALGNQGISQGRDLALQKLANDENAALQNLSFSQQQANQQGAEDLNSRGLLNGQTYQNPTGLAGQQKTQLNTPFANQRSQLQTAYNTNTQGVNQDYGLQQQNLNLAHTNALQDIQTDARRQVQDQQNSYQFGAQQANQAYNNQIAALQRQKAQLIAGDLAPATQLYGMQKGIMGYGS